jgi:hypothetical protein
MKIRQVTVVVRPGADKATVKKVVIGASPSELVLQKTTVTKIQQRLGELYQLQAHQIIVKQMDG